jgi:diguanylate cyclase (GGDEF)-like protein
MSRRFGTEGAVLLLDLDHFKFVNDTLGRDAGDELIASVAGILEETLGSTDIWAHLGGDTFAVGLAAADRPRAEAVAETLVTSIREQAARDAGPSSRGTSVSLGISSLDGGARTGEEVLTEAELTMYDAKRAGGDRWAHALQEAGVEPRMKEQIAWVERIRRVLQEGGFCLYAQPIVNLQTGAVDQHEVLLRLIEDDGRVLTPDKFLGVAERYDLIQEIDRWVLRSAIAMLGEHPDLVLEVNVSGKSLNDDALLAFIESELAEAGVRPWRLIIEITETAAITDIDVARRFAKRLRALGCRFALDDFGSGFASFVYLKHLPFDYLKIDGEFIAGCRHNRTDQLVIEALVMIARGLGIQTIAEFVADDETRCFVERQGIDYAQGYAVGRPAPLSNLFARC